MRKTAICTLCLLCLLYAVAQAQTFVELHELQPPEPLTDLHNQAVFSDAGINAHVIWAPQGFSKDRQGAPVQEQIFVLEGKARVSFAAEAQEVQAGSWVLIPGNTPHTIEVLGEQPLKILAVQYTTGG